MKIRDIKAWAIKTERRQKRPYLTPEAEMTEHVCSHCNHRYKGRFCPQCGLPAKWKGFNYKSLFLNFLDVWGMGNRPMMRTIKDLFWRPGYMIRDYLAGHHLNYFPPFKMLAVFCILLATTFFIFNIKVLDDNAFIQGIDNIDKKDLSATFIKLFDKTKEILVYFYTHDLYRYILMNIFVVIVCRIVFRKVRPHNEREPYNIVETFFGQIYINVQFLIINIVYVLLTWHKSDGDLFPYNTPFWITIPVLMYDFHQLYGLSYWASFIRIIRISILLFLLYFIIIILILITIITIGVILEG